MKTEEFSNSEKIILLKAIKKLEEIVPLDENKVAGEWEKISDRIDRISKADEKKKISILIWLSHLSNANIAKAVLLSWIMMTFGGMIGYEFKEREKFGLNGVLSNYDESENANNNAVTRGHSVLSSSDSSIKNIEITADESQVSRIIGEALKAKLRIEAQRNDAETEIKIYGFKDMDKDQVVIKALLEVNNKTEGDVRVLIK